MGVFCGVDWAEGHHDVALVDDAGTVLVRRRIAESPAGLGELLGMLAAAGDSSGEPVPVAIETPHGLLVAALRASRPVYAINPLAVARYRERHTAAGRKSDHGDAVVLANILRTDRHVHRMLPADSEQVQAVAVLARAQQDAVWRRTRAVNELRSLLREYYPAFLETFATRPAGLADGQARAVLRLAPSPARSWRCCAASSCASRDWWNRRWPPRRSRCSTSWTLPVTGWTGSPQR